MEESAHLKRLLIYIERERNSYRLFMGIFCGLKLNCAFFTRTDPLCMALCIVCTCTAAVFPFSLMTGPFKHMINPHADVENLDSRPLSRGGWATLRSQLPPLRGPPRDADPPRPASRNTHSPRPVSRGSFLTLPSGLDSPKPQKYTGRESPRETDIRPKTALNRRESRPGIYLSIPLYDLNKLLSIGEFCSGKTLLHLVCLVLSKSPKSLWKGRS